MNTEGQVGKRSMGSNLRLSDSIARVQPSPTLAASARAQELKAQGKDIISFTVGEPDFDVPDHIKRAADKAMAQGFSKYTAVGGIAPLKETILQKMKRDQGLEYKASEVVVTNGGKQAIAAACAVLLNPGDEVVIPSPYWTSYPDIVELCGGKSVFARTTPDEGYVLRPEVLLQACTPKTKMIILNSPSNPTGAGYSREELRALADAVLSLPNWRDIVILSDEVYEYFVYRGFEHSSIAAIAPNLRDNILIVNAFSKAYAMTGWRVGYAVGPKAIIDAMTTHQSQFTSNVCSVAQYAAAAAYDDASEFPRKMAAEFVRRYEIVCEAVKEMPGISLPTSPCGAFYAFLRVEGLFGKRAGNKVITCAQDFTDYLLEKFDTVVVQGEAFGDPGAVRMSYAMATPQLKKGLERIAEAARSIAAN